MRHVVCMITDRSRLGEDADASLIRRIVLAARAGLHLIQIRERDMPDGALLTLVERAVHAVRGSRTRILVNDRADVAMAAGAHGVHLRSDSMPASRVRTIVPPGFLIGRSIHSVAEAAHAVDEGGVDYLLFGTVFPTSSKPGVVAAGVSGLTEAVAAARRVPVLAVGGVTAQTMGRLPVSGCAGFAAIGLFADAPEDAVGRMVADATAPWDNRA